MLEALGARLRMQGARIADSLHIGVTHVVCNPHCFARISLIQVLLTNKFFFPYHFRTCIIIGLSVFA